MRVRRESTSWVTSLMILAFSLGERVVNHLARRCEEKSAVSTSEVPPACGKKKNRGGPRDEPLCLVWTGESNSWIGNISQ